MTITKTLNIKEYFKQTRETINDALDQALPDAHTYPSEIHQAMRYSLMAGGKRLRPILLIASAETVGGSREEVMPFACAIEMIHTYTLIHDDLPAIDNDDLRRGAATNHKKFGESTAILAGDALLTYAFEMMSDTTLVSGCGPQNILSAINSVAKSVGAMGTIGGQMADLLSEGEEGDLPTLEYIHTHKTGEMILAAVRAGAILSGASEEEFAHLSDYARSVGLAFQIIDDILDVEGESSVMGKNTASDARVKKITYPSFLGIAESRRRAASLTDKAIEALTPFADRAEVLKDIAEYIIARSF